MATKCFYEFITRKKEKERNARKQEGNMTERGQRQTDEKDDPLIILREDIERIRASISDSSLTHRYYNKTVLNILELWSSCASATVDLMIPLAEQYWENQSEFEQLAKKISNTCSACVKFTAMTVNLTEHPIPENCGSDVKEKATQEMNNAADTLSRLIQAAIKTSLKVSEDNLLNMTMWLLFSVHHVAQNVLQPNDKPTTECKEEEGTKETEQEKKDPEPVKESTDVTASLNNLLTQLDVLQMELSNQYVIEKNEQNTEGGETDDSCKNDQQAINKLANVYTGVVDKICENGK